ncbi:MAG: nucleotide sugar dehydrogenase, partial [Candidatus Binatia bacterium]
MRISIFGLGYVGVVTAACLAKSGHKVTGVDVHPGKVDLVNAGLAPIVEPELQDLIESGVRAGSLRATEDAEAAISASDVSLICVGTPTADGGAVSFEALDKVMEQIGAAIRCKGGPHSVVVRSTVPPGTTEDRLAPALCSASGRGIGGDLELCYNPEFLREGSAIRDFYHPPFTLIGSFPESDVPRVAAIYKDVSAQLFYTSYSIAESVKYFCNAFHALKIAFANEAGALLKAVGVDARKTMHLFCEDRDLNLSSAYLRPGFAFGGSCLPKDVRALVNLARTRKVQVPLLEQILPSNELHVNRAFQLITENGRRQVALFGLAFKQGTDDFRESPLVALAERLIGKGYPIRIFDRNLELARLTGKNREFVQREIPHLDQLMACSPEAVLD